MQLVSTLPSLCRTFQRNAQGRFTEAASLPAKAFFILPHSTARRQTHRTEGTQSSEGRGHCHSVLPPPIPKSPSSPLSFACTSDSSPQQVRGKATKQGSRTSLRPLGSVLQPRRIEEPGYTFTLLHTKLGSILLSLW